MKSFQPKDMKSFLQVALGSKQADLAIVNGKIVNVFTGNIDTGVIYISQGYIAHIEYDDLTNINAKEIFDAQGAYITPGFIDAHMHIESSMMTPRNFGKVALVWGSTTVVTDPHEIGNVWGVEGVKYMHDSALSLPMRQLIDIPSCVPSVPGKENAGADFTAKQIDELASLENVIGLAEVMDFLAVVHGEDRMMDILNTAKKHGLYLQGHAPGLSGRMLSAYLAAGPCTDHETSGSFNAYEKYRAGMFIDARQSSICRNVKEIVKGLKDVRYKDHLCICTDDRESDDILNEGHLNHTMQVAIDCGLDPIDVIRCATYNNAREMKMDHLGAIAPGYVADLCFLDDLNVIKPTHVFFEGKLVAKNQELVVEIEDESYPLETTNSISIKDLSVDDFVIKAPIESGEITCNVMSFLNATESLTTLVKKQIKVENYRLILDDPNLKFVAVVNRYQGNDNIALHLVENFGTTHGAIASTVSHDSHNLTIVFDEAENALVAANTIKDIKGGMVAVNQGQVLATLPLPLAGLMSLKTAQELSVDAQVMKQAYRQLGLVEQENPLVRIVTLALPVVPDYKMSDLGLVEVSTKNIVPLFA